MPIDPRLAALGNPVQGVDYAKIQGQALALNEAKAETERRAQAAKDEAAAKQASDQIRGLLKDSLMQDPDTGVWTYDRAKIMPVLGVLPPEVAKALNDADASVLNAHKAQTDALKGIANLVDLTGNDAGFFDLELDRAEKNHQVSATMAGTIREAIKKDPSKVAYITGQLLGKPEDKPVVVGPDSALVSPQGQELYKGQGKPPTPPNVGSFEDYVTAKYGPRPTPAQIEQARKDYGEAGRATVVNVAGASSDDPKIIAEAIARGEQPPDFTGLYRMTAPVRAQLGRMGYDLTKAEQDWKATQKYFQTLNGAQQIRLRQAVSFTKDSLDIVSDLAKQWDGGKFPLLNKFQLSAAKGGALGPDAQAIATKLDAQISDIVSELGTVYKGGNSSTDETLKLAAKNLQSDWSKATMLSAIDLIRKNLTIRENSIKNTTAVANHGNEYAPQTAEPVPPQVLAAGPGEHTFANGQVWKVSADGKTAVRIK